jgi:hypothetical protein
MEMTPSERQAARDRLRSYNFLDEHDAELTKALDALDARDELLREALRLLDFIGNHDAWPDWGVTVEAKIRATLEGA